MINYIQSFYESVGKYGCYFLLLLKMAEKKIKKKIDLIETLVYAEKKDWVYYNFDNHKDPDNFYVKNPSMLFSYLTGKKYHVRKETADYQSKENELEILFYSLSDKNAELGIGHFALADYDTLQGSNTVKNGKVYSKRIFKEET